MMRSQSGMQRKHPTHPTSTFVPTPENKELILNYFKYNNFQDFNTWQQIARTKLDYEYLEHPNHFQCNLTLQWDDRLNPLIHAKAQGHTKKSAKKRALGFLIQQLVCKALISRGFRQENFVQHLPRRRKNYSDQSSDQEQVQTENAKLQGLLASFLSCLQTVLQTKSPGLLLKCWNHALIINSVEFAAGILSALSNVEVNEFEVKRAEVADKPRQFLNGSEVKFALKEDLTDFMRYFQLSKDWQERKIEGPELRKRKLPSEQLLSQNGELPQGTKLMQSFHPIELSKLVCDRRKLKKADRSLLEFQEIELPLFEYPGLVLTLPTLQKMHFLLLFQSHNFLFCLQVLDLMQKHLLLANIRLGSPNLEASKKAEEYYLKHKNNLTAEFIQLLWNRIGSKDQSLKLQGMLLPKKADEVYYQFIPKESEDYVNLKINRRANTNEFEEMKQISVREMVLLQSKFSGQWIAQIFEVSTVIRVFLPAIQELNEPHPMTLIKLCNAKLYQKTSSALAQTSQSCLKLMQENTHLLWQPPTYPILPVIGELLLEWQTLKQSVLIISPNSQHLHQNLQSLGFKITLLGVGTDEKSLLKGNMVISGPTAICCQLLKNYAFSRVIVDQAHALSEISILSAIVKDCRQLWLIGDPYLPRMSVSSQQGRRREMNKSLFQRLFNEGKECMTFESELEQSVYYENVLGWINKWLYKGQLRLLGDEKQLPVVKGFLWPSTSFRICILHHPQTESISDYLNKQTELVATICNNILKTGYTAYHQISCSVISAKVLPLLNAKLAQVIPQYLQKNNNLRSALSKMTGLVTGSRYSARDVSIMMTGNAEDCRDQCLLMGWLIQGRRGAILITDVHDLAKNKDWAPFLSWCNSNKLICSLER